MGIQGKRPTNIFIQKQISNTVTGFSSVAPTNLWLLIVRCWIMEVVRMSCDFYGAFQQEQSASYCDGMKKFTNYRETVLRSSFCFFINHWRLLPMLPRLCQQMLQTGLETMSLELCKKGCLWCITTKQNFDKMS